MKNSLIIMLLGGLCLLSIAETQEKSSAGAIFDAVKKGDRAAVETLLKQNPKLAGAKDKNKETPFHIAACFGDRDLAVLTPLSRSESRLEDQDVQRRHAAARSRQAGQERRGQSARGASGRHQGCHQ